LKTLKDMDLKGKKVLVRVDFNVPLKGGQVADDERIRAALPTINYLLDQNCSMTLMSHLGRPKGKVARELSLEPVAQRLAGLLGRNLEVRAVQQVDKKFFLTPEKDKPPHQIFGGEGKPEPEISLLENLRFWPEEEAGDAGFAKSLALLGDVFVQEAFACCHRAHASIMIPAFKKDMPACAGFLLEKEVKFLKRLLTRPKKPFVVIIGGKKVETNSDNYLTLHFT